jgi:hypothetical protein
MGEIQYRRGEHAAAERYLERALSLDPKLASVAALRGSTSSASGASATRRSPSRRARAREGPADRRRTASPGAATCAARSRRR